MPAEWWSQKFAPEGSAAADGIKKQLGQPKFDPLTVLTREAAQNSWDARAGEDVSFNIDISRLGDRAETWRALFTRSLPTESGLLARTRWRADTLVMTVGDRGTVGLGGPSRAGVRVEEDERADFVQFLRNVGEPRDQALGGGTYGFGKGIYYTVSRASAILVDTHSVDQKAGRRLMGAAMTNKWTSGEHVYTGRHWWGQVVDDVPDPVTSVEARELAQSLGLPGFSDDEHGTDVVIIDPELGMFDEGRPRTVEEALDYIRSSMVWHLWPKTIGGPKGVMRFSTSLDGVRHTVPAADEVPALEPFVLALDKARRRDGHQYSRKTAPFDVGVLSTQLAPVDVIDKGDLNVARPFAAPLRHIARMRQVELVIDYFVGEEHPDPRFGYAGVFRASVETDEVFGRAEPPTHDSWVLEGLTGTDYGVVNGLKSFLRTSIQKDVQPKATQPVSKETVGLGRLAARLGSVTRGFAGTGAGADGSSGGRKGGGGGGGGGGRRSARPRFVQNPAVVVEGGRAVLRALVEIPESHGARVVKAAAQVVLDSGGIETEPPEGAGMAPLVWRAQARPDRVVADQLHLEPGPAEQWWLSADVTDDVAVRLTVDWSS